MAIDRRGSQTIAGDRTWFYLLRSSAITIAGSQTIAEVCFHMIADDRRPYCDLRSAIRDHMETSLYFLQLSVESNFAFALVLVNKIHAIFSTNGNTNQNQSCFRRTRFPALGNSYMYLLRILIGSLCCLHLLRLARVITLVPFYDTQLETALSSD